jgi:hypothetical protein
LADPDDDDQLADHGSRWRLRRWWERFDRHERDPDEEQTAPTTVPPLDPPAEEPSSTTTAPPTDPPDGPTPSTTATTLPVDPPGDEPPSTTPTSTTMPASSTTTTPPTTPPSSDPQPSVAVLPGNVPFDYQIGAPYTPLPAGVGVVSRDWFDGQPQPGAYNICYINAFQTQGDDSWVDRPDERSNWPQDLVLYSLGDDPNWGGEYLINIDTAARRSAAAAWVSPMVQTCADKGFDAVEYDNLDSWTRFDGTPMASQVPFDRSDTIAYATLLAEVAHDRGLAVGQKNTADLTRAEARDRIGFDFAIVEECGQWDECEAFTSIYGDRVVAVEYTSRGFANACSRVGGEISVVRRDVSVTAPGSGSYIYDEC